MTNAPLRAGIYVHFPWCLAKCPYCDFVSYAAPSRGDAAGPSGAAGASAASGASADPIDHRGYADAVIREIDARAILIQERQIESVFFGGGTPSLWQARELGRVLAHAKAALAVSPDPEVTVECNPTSLDEDRARALADVGVGRLSIGVQSLSDERLRHLGRLHDADGGRQAVRDAMRAGMPRVSADLIFGLPGQSPAEARDEALELADLGLAHLSCYQLTIEPGTRFGELARRGRLPLADDGVVAESFLAIDEALGARGYRHYEVSNYAQPGEEARHNLGYWRGDEYLGLGCAAVGFVREDDRRLASDPARQAPRGVRYRNAVLPDRFVQSTLTAEPAAAGEGDGISESSERLDAPTLLRERIMLGLRVAGGIDIDAEARSLGTEGWTPQRTRAAAWLESRGRIVRDGPRVCIPRPAWLWTDDTAARLF